MSERIDGGPRSALVVGAGIVGLSTAWFLQERGVEVTVLDRNGVAAGASWGNAGWVSPALTIPLNSPSLLRYGLRAMFDRAAPLHIPMTVDGGLWRFLALFAANCRTTAWRKAVEANVPLNEECIEAFDVLVANGVDAPVTDAPITALFRTPGDAEHLMDELRELERAGQKVDVTGLSGAALREQVPLASPAITAGISVNGQRYIDPGRFVHALGRAVEERGAKILRDDVRSVWGHGTGVAVETHRGDLLRADAAVVAAGAWLSRLAASRVRVPVQAGRGYSFTVPVDRPVPGPVYLPDVRVACTPYRGALRVAGTMEFRAPHDPVIRDRVDAIVASARPLLDGVRWDERSDVWVGPRPVTPDGRALIGEISRNVYVAGGHGMWGLAHGPVTGRLLAEQITTGKQPDALRPFDPVRRTLA
ncbi:glycine/D-amino acid oxidase, deaminating [Mycolicibacterium phlei]|jgi:D-amino-acid dehydrogenase|uniref:D-amino acid dehydrogenase n=1 Tax=Mycolicibacterium phlei DSM 43239 = CCUG 21000 TaxID=1226750 RepID=A0A5N5UXW7_MYCPH|nr:FAD-binding oxidoreductase [Mycolicibacterium phlei]VEG07589.1 glycine/D-amino acid oxidase, deaminating [Mycobacteroides chelonae]AMO59459.1 D-amino acid dehydrogenase small subunit [Mycolicibacterium phlei]EID09837.1 glycine/D-amino acid oxidase, deaminating [Mycolicibacterium phlei RIVM601174]KAB7753299.1 D-amino acid dehydrogenase [Mycolicibacterium phlei DSM 43239 = CCUG 21000]KXW62200.1 D-amino acid dehydrogenase [Mycolicibacterium phlei DSM 43239 = CCUG 21000]